jgi:aspartate kinase
VASERLVAVVSAQNGSTDALERKARRAASPPARAGKPSGRALDLLWSIGEIRSVALLTLHLEALGISAAGLNVHETGLRLSPGSVAAGPETVLFHGENLRAALAAHAVVVVPGFLATDSADTIVSLGRGGSDLTAVLLARSLRAARCELVKDVPGYFSADPNRDSRAQQLPALTYSRALELADAGCDLVQRAAIEAAAHAGLPLIIRSMDERAPVSVLSHGPAHAPAAGKIEFPDLCCHPEPALAGAGPSLRIP